MTVTINLQARHLAIVAAVIAAGVVFAVWWASPAVSQTAGPDPVDSFAVVARADNPVDALAASSVAGQLGAPVYLTPSAGLDEQAAQGLVDTDPDVVVLAGGQVALSEQVEEQIGELLPDATIRRFGGAGRTETARLINELPDQLGIDRPVLAGATVAGDVGIDGQLTVAGTDVTATLAAVLDRVNGLEERTGTLETDLAAANGRIDGLEADNATLTGRVDSLETDNATLTGRVDSLETDNATLTGRVDSLETDNATLTGRVDSLETDLTAANGRIGALESQVGALEATLDGVARTSVDGRDTLRFEAMNVQIVNGTGTTDGTPNGEGNLIIGYNGPRSGTVAADRAGSHYLIVGDRHHWTRHGGIVAGFHNTASGTVASVAGGFGNTASGDFASVAGGNGNTASGFAASVSGGSGNTASGTIASVAGGFGNTASGSATSVAGGRNGTVSDFYDSLIGNTDFPDS